MFQLLVLILRSLISYYFSSKYETFYIILKILGFLLSLLFFFSFHDVVLWHTSFLKYCSQDSRYTRSSVLRYSLHSFLFLQFHFFCFVSFLLLKFQLFDIRYLGFIIQPYLSCFLFLHLFVYFWEIVATSVSKYNTDFFSYQNLI